MRLPTASDLSEPASSVSEAEPDIESSRPGNVRLNAAPCQTQSGGTYCPQALQNPLLRWDFLHEGGSLHCSDANLSGSGCVALRHLGTLHQDKRYTLSLR